MQINESLLDTSMLKQYLDLVGPQLIHQSLAMFEQMMPGYLAVLDSNMTARDQKGITEEGHKIKGAAGSVGLHHLQQLAQQIQTPTLPAWWDNVQDWVDELKQEWRNDTQVLRTWVENAEKNNSGLSQGARMLRQHQGNHQPAHGYSVLCSGRLYKIPMHYTTNNIKNVSVLVRRFLKMCDADECLPISCINPVTITLSVGVRVMKK